MKRIKNHTCFSATPINPVAKATCRTLGSVGFATLLSFTLACNSGADNGKKAQNKKNTNSSHTQALSSLSAHLPKDTAALIRLKLGDDLTDLVVAKNVKNLVATDMQPGDLQGLSEQQKKIAQASQESLKKMQDLVQHILKAGLIPTEAEDGKIKKGSVKELIAFLDWKKEGEPLAGLIIESATGGKQTLANLKTELSKGEIKLDDVEQGFKISHEGTEVYLLADGNFISASSDPALAKGVLKDASAPAAILGTLKQRVPDYMNSPIVGYSDFKLLESRNEDLDQAGLNYAAFKFIEENKLLHSNAEVHFDLAKTPLKDSITKLGSVENKIPLPLMNKLAVVLSLSDATLGTIKSELSNMAEALQQPELQEALSFLKPIENFRAGIVEAGPKSPFPEIFLASNSSNAAELLATTETALDQNVGPMIGGLQWQNKNIDGTDIKYILSPFGVGLYLGAGNSKVVLASGESGISTILQEQNELSSNQKTLNSKASAAGPALASYYINGRKLAKIIRQLSQTVAPFTGGKAVIDPLFFEQLESQGETIAVVSPLKDGFAFNAWSITY